MAIAVPTVLIALGIIAAVMGPGRGTPGAIMGWIFILLGAGSPLLYLTGAILGAVGWGSKKTKNLVPAAGTILNVVFLVIGVIFLISFISTLKFGFR
jgi:hypothetical protein